MPIRQKSIGGPPIEKPHGEDLFYFCQQPPSIRSGKMSSGARRQLLSFGQETPLVRHGDSGPPPGVEIHAPDAKVPRRPPCRFLILSVEEGFFFGGQTARSGR